MRGHRLPLKHLGSSSSPVASLSSPIAHLLSYTSTFFLIPTTRSFSPSPIALDLAKPPSISIFMPSPVSPPSSSDDPPPSPTIPVLATLSSPFEEPGPQSPSGPCKPLSLWPGTYHSPVTHALWKARRTISERLWSPTLKDGPPQQTLLTKTPKDSRVSVLYNFSTDYILREQYRNPWNECRVGSLMEDLDALAGTVAVKHCSDDDSTTRPLILVTASVDKIHIKKAMTLDSDLKLTGSVAWVGRSSMEIRIEVRQRPTGASEEDDPVALTANFTFVARDSKTGKAARVNHLNPQTEQEKLFFEDGELHDAKRKKLLLQHQQAGSHDYKSQEYSQRLQKLLAEGRILRDMPALADRNSILIRDTRLENAYICQPQQRNMHGRIFGGFLMRLAFELAFSTCYIFAGHKPLFIEVDRIDFLRPVDVGDFLRFKSCVLYTELENPEQPLINIEVVAYVTRPELRTVEVSNTFYFTFTVHPDVTKDGTFTVRRVLPETEEEARRVFQRYDADHEQQSL